MQEVMSSFGFTSKNQALTQSQSSKSLVVSIVSAFFIVLIVGMLLSFVQKAVNGQPAAATAVVDGQEQVAFQPGQYIGQEITRGYISIR